MSYLSSLIGKTENDLLQLLGYANIEKEKVIISINK